MTSIPVIETRRLMQRGPDAAIGGTGAVCRHSAAPLFKPKGWALD